MGGLYWCPHILGNWGWGGDISSEMSCLVNYVCMHACMHICMYVPYIIFCHNIAGIIPRLQTMICDTRGLEVTIWGRALCLPKPY